MSDLNSDDTNSTVDTGAEAGDTKADANDSSTTSTKAALDELTETIERVSGQLADSARTAWDSEQRREVQDSVLRGLTGIAAAIEEQVKKFSETEDAKRFTARMEETTDKIADQVRSSKSFQDVADGLAKGFSAAAISIEKWLRQQEAAAGSKAAASAQADEGTQEIAIVTHTATTASVATPTEPALSGATEDDEQLSAPDNIVHF